MKNTHSRARCSDHSELFGALNYQLLDHLIKEFRLDVKSASATVIPDITAVYIIIIPLLCTTYLNIFF